MPGLRRHRMEHRRERGFAMLIVFALAAAGAVMLYMEAPRIIFEGQRNKEQLLIERGEQYKRAVQVYYRKNKKLPQRVEDLERGTETRFLRRRYKDPFTGKDDWKFIETDGVNLKNSLVKKPPDPSLAGRPGMPGSGDPSQQQQQQQQQQQPQQAVTTFNAFGQPVPANPCTPGQPGCETNTALQRRASDRPAVNAGGEPQGLPACDPAQPYDPTKCDPSKQFDPSAALQQQLQQQQQQQQQIGIPGQSPFPGQPYPGGQQPQPYPGQQGGQPYPGQQTGPMPMIPGIPGMPGQAQPYPGGQQPYPGQPGGTFPIGRPATGYPQAPISSQTGGVGTAPMPGGFNPLGGAVAGAAQQNAALDAIGKLLITPRQGGIGGPQAGAAAMGPGIVGVASKHEGLGIKIYAERNKYQEWEFVYDPKDEKVPNMAGNQQGQQPGGGLGGSQPGQGQGQSGRGGFGGNGGGMGGAIGGGMSPFPGGGGPGGPGGGFPGRQR